VRHADELDLERPDPYAIAWLDGYERMRTGEPVLLQFRLDERQRQWRAVHRAIHVWHDVGHRADVVFVTVRQHQGGDRASLLQVREIRNDPIDAEQLRVGEHHARIDDDRRFVPAERQHVHAELAESAKRHHFKHSTQEHRPRRRCSRRNGFDEEPRLAAQSGSWERLKFQVAGCPRPHVPPGQAWCRAESGQHTTGE
jgi:hypothetical protein